MNPHPPYQLSDKLLKVLQVCLALPIRGAFCQSYNCFVELAIGLSLMANDRNSRWLRPPKCTPALPTKDRTLQTKLVFYWGTSVMTQSAQCCKDSVGVNWSAECLQLCPGTAATGHQITKFVTTHWSPHTVIPIPINNTSLLFPLINTLNASQST